MESDETLKYTDFKLMSNDGTIHPCRKHVLDSNSLAFKAMLETDWVETKNGLMKVKDYDAKTVKKLHPIFTCPKGREQHRRNGKKKCSTWGAYV